MNAPRKKGFLPDTSLADLELAWMEREEEAKAMAERGFLSTSVSLRIYSLEILLKTLVCKRLGVSLLPAACKTHELDEVLIYTGLQGEIEAPSFSSTRLNWGLLVNYSKNLLNDQRYKPRVTYSPEEADLINQALDDPASGVLAWLLSDRP